MTPELGSADLPIDAVSGITLLHPPTRKHSQKQTRITHTHKYIQNSATHFLYQTLNGCDLK